MENQNVVGTSPAPIESTQANAPQTALPTRAPNSQTLWIGVVLFVVLAIIIVYAMMQAKKRKMAREAQLREDLASNTGGLGNGSVDNVTKDVSPENYAGVEADAQAIKAAGCWAVGYCIPVWGFSTNAEKVLSILRGKTKRQLAGLNETFQRLYSRSLDNWIQSNLYASDIQKAYQIMLNAK